MLTFLCDSLYNSKASCASDSQVYGILAQLGEHLPYKQRVIGSSPIVSTREKPPVLFGVQAVLLYWFPCLKNGTAYACGCGFHVCGCCSGQGKTGCPAANFSANHILTFCKRFDETGKVTRFRYFFRFENLEKIFEKPLTNRSEWCIIIYVAERCDAEKK